MEATSETETTATVSPFAGLQRNIEEALAELAGVRVVQVPVAVCDALEAAGAVTIDEYGIRHLVAPPSSSGV